MNWNLKKYDTRFFKKLSEIGQNRNKNRNKIGTKIGIK